jgi:hypothetical protein
VVFREAVAKRVLPKSVHHPEVLKGLPSSSKKVAEILERAVREELEKLGGVF